MKRILSGLLCILMVLSLLPVSALAENEEPEPAPAPVTETAPEPEPDPEPEPEPAPETAPEPEAEPETVLVTGVAVSGETALTLGGLSAQLNAAVEPADATNKELTWTSDNEAVATVSQSGLVTPVSVGTAVIKAEAKDGSGVFGTHSVTVAEAAPAPEPQSLTSVTITLNGTWNEGEDRYDYTLSNIDLTRNVVLSVVATANPADVQDQLTYNWQQATVSGGNITWAGVKAANSEGSTSAALTLKPGYDFSNIVMFRCQVTYPGEASYAYARAIGCYTLVKSPLSVTFGGLNWNADNRQYEIEFEGGATELALPVTATADPGAAQALLTYQWQYWNVPAEGDPGWVNFDNSVLPSAATATLEFTSSTSAYIQDGKQYRCVVTCSDVNYQPVETSAVYELSQAAAVTFDGDYYVGTSGGMASYLRSFITGASTLTLPIAAHADSSYTLSYDWYMVRPAPAADLRLNGQTGVSGALTDTLSLTGRTYILDGKEFYCKVTATPAEGAATVQLAYYSITARESEPFDIISETRGDAVRPGNTIKLYTVASPSNATRPVMRWQSSDEDVATINPETSQGSGKENDSCVVTGVSTGTVAVTAALYDEAFPHSEPLYTKTFTVRVMNSIPVTGIDGADSVAVGMGEPQPLSLLPIPTNADDQTLVWRAADPDRRERRAVRG